MRSSFSALLRRYFPLSGKDSATCFCILLGAAFICVILRLVNESDVYISMILISAVLITSRVTTGYFYGLLASIVGVFGINYVFTPPYFEFNFTLANYPITFLSMLATSLITSTLTSQIKQQEQVKIEIEKEKTRANLLRAVSHDLRTPLTSISGATSAILENENVFTPEQKHELMQEVLEEANWVIRMVENLLSVTRINGETAKVTKQEEAVEEVISESVAKFHAHFPGAAVRVSIPDNLLFVPMDATLIEQVLINLLENAVIHGETVHQITITVEKEGDWVFFSVLDDGVGIAPDKLDKIFEGYSEGGDQAKREGVKSMGIGLSVCKTIVQAHGGAITAENADPSGALFRFTLPLKGKPESDKISR